MKINTKRKIYISSIALLVISYYSISFIRLIAGEDKAYYMTYEAPSDYSNLFATENSKKLELIASFNNKVKNSIVIYLHDSTDYICIYKINLSENIPLTKLIKEKNGHDKIKNVYFNINEHYGRINNERNITIHCCDDTFNVKDKVFLTFDADSVNIPIKNDSIIFYSLLLNNVTIKYKDDGPIDLQLENKHQPKKIKFSICLLKKEKRLYMITMSSVNQNATLRNYTLYDLLKK